MKHQVKVSTVLGQKVAIVTKSELILSGREYFSRSIDSGAMRVKRPKSPDQFKTLYFTTGHYDGKKSEIRRKQLQQQVQRSIELWGQQVQQIAIIEPIQEVAKHNPVAVKQALKMLRFSFSVVENGVERISYIQRKKEKELINN